MTDSYLYRQQIKYKHAKNQWLLSEEHTRLRFVAQKRIPISSERQILRQWLQSGRHTSLTTLDITAIPLQDPTVQEIQDSNKRHYTTTICNTSPSKGVELYDQKEKRTRFLPKGFYDYTYGKIDLVPYQQENRHSFSTEQEKTFHGPVSTKNLEHDHGGKIKWMTKFWTGFAPVGRVMKRRKEWQHDKCFRCLSTSETSMHVIQCPEKSSRTQ